MTTAHKSDTHKTTAHPHAAAHKPAADKATAHKPAAVAETKPAAPVNHLEGEHITQHKPTMQEGFARHGGRPGVEDIGVGSVVEEAPAVRSTVSDTDRVVQQGDEVVVHGRSIIDGLGEARGRVIKVNQDGSIAVRIVRSTGQPFDVPGPVRNVDTGDGGFYWTWPPDGEETLPAAGKAE